MENSRGMTLVDVLVALSVAAGLSAMAWPLCRTLLQDTRMSSSVNALVHGLHAARHLAEVERRDAVVCRSGDGARCAAAGDWSAGWILFVNRDGIEPPAVDAGDPVIAVHHDPARALRITSNRAAFVLRPQPLRATNGTAVFCDDRGAAAARAVIVSTTGRPRLARRTAAGRPLSCAP